MSDGSRVARLQEAEYAAALARWESEGGKDPAGWPGVSSVFYVRGLPSLPAGHTSQVAWGFRDPVDRQQYDFFRVYHPPQLRHGQGPVCVLDEDLCYWRTILEPAGEWPPSKPACRWINYRQSRQLLGSGLTFRRFSSPLPLDEKLLHLLREARLPAEQPPARPSFPLVERLAG